MKLEPYADITLPKSTVKRLSKLGAHELATIALMPAHPDCETCTDCTDCHAGVLDTDGTVIDPTECRVYLAQLAKAVFKDSF